MSHLPRLLIADDHQSATAGTAHLLWEEWPDIIKAHTVAETIRTLDTFPIDLVLLDLQFNESHRSGFTVLRHCAAHHPATRLLLLTGADGPEIARGAKEQGAHGCLGKHEPPDVLRDAVRTILTGGEWWGDLLSAPMLSPQQLRVLRAVARGLTQKEAAQYLVCSESTIETHLRKVREKMQVGKTFMAALAAQKTGLLMPGLIDDDAPIDMDQVE